MQSYEKYIWLAGSTITNKLYCFPCLLFNTDFTTTWNSTGFCDFNNFVNSAKRHDMSEKHLSCFLSMNKFGNTIRIEMSLSWAYKNSIDKHNAKGNVLYRLIEITCFLGRKELAFRGHNETQSSANIRI